MLALGSRLLVTGLLIVGVHALASSAASAAFTRYVDDDRAQCAKAAFTSIQPAIDAAAAGDTIVVCDGVYPGSLTIGAGKSNLTLRAFNVGRSLLTATGGPGPDGLLSVSGATNVAIRRFAIRGTTAAPADVGIHLIDIEPTSALIRDNGIEGMSRAAVFMDGGGATIIGNIIGVSGVAGVELDEAGATISENQIRPGATATGVEVRTSSVDVVGNRISDAAAGVRLHEAFGDTPARVRYNVITESGTGIHTLCWTGGRYLPDGTWSPEGPRSPTQISYNEIFRNGIGIHLQGCDGRPGSAGIAVQRNVVQHNERGILADLFDGDETVRVYKNWIGLNDARFNTVQDCFEGGFTLPLAPPPTLQNTWVDNRGTNNVQPAGICR
jgi:hypothetical protein